mgnify:FL=1
MRTETPTVSEVHEGYRLQCTACTFKIHSLANPKAPAVHLCNDRVTVKWVGQEVKGQKTVPMSAGQAALLAKKAGLKDKRR